MSAAEPARPPRRPPAPVALVAKTHWLVGGVVLGALLPLHLFTRRLPFVEFGARTYVAAVSFAGAYLLAGTLVWCGAPFGRVLSRVCGLLYLARPNFGSHLWDLMSSADYQAHFGIEAPKPPI